MACVTWERPTSAPTRRGHVCTPRCTHTRGPVSEGLLVLQRPRERWTEASFAAARFEAAQIDQQRFFERGHLTNERIDEKQRFIVQLTCSSEARDRRWERRLRKSPYANTAEEVREPAEAWQLWRAEQRDHKKRLKLEREVALGLFRRAARNDELDDLRTEKKALLGELEHLRAAKEAARRAQRTKKQPSTAPQPRSTDGGRRLPRGKAGSDVRSMPSLPIPVRVEPGEPPKSPSATSDGSVSRLRRSLRASIARASSLGFDDEVAPVSEKVPAQCADTDHVSSAAKESSTTDATSDIEAWEEFAAARERAMQAAKRDLPPADNAAASPVSIAAPSPQARDEWANTEATSDTEAWAEAAAGSAMQTLMSIGTTPLRNPTDDAVAPDSHDDVQGDVFAPIGSVDTEAQADSHGTSDPEAWEQFEAARAARAVPTAPGEASAGLAIHAADAPPELGPAAPTFGSQPGGEHAPGQATPERTTMDQSHRRRCAGSSEGTEIILSIGDGEDVRPDVGQVENGASSPRVDDAEQSRATSDPEAWEELYAHQATQAATDAEVRPDLGQIENGVSSPRVDDAEQSRATSDPEAWEELYAHRATQAATDAEVRPDLGQVENGVSSPRVDDAEHSRATSDPEAWEELYAHRATQASTDAEVPGGGPVEAQRPDADAHSPMAPQGDGIGSRATQGVAGVQQQFEVTADATPSGARARKAVAAHLQEEQTRNAGPVGLATDARPELGQDLPPRAHETENSHATSDPEAWEEFYAQRATQAAIDVEVPRAQHVEASGPDAHAREGSDVVGDGAVDNDGVTDAANGQQQLEHAADTSPSAAQRHRDVAGQPQAAHARYSIQGVASQSGVGTSMPGFVGLAPGVRPGFGLVADADSVPQVDETEDSRATSDPEAWEEFYAQRATQAAIDVEVPLDQHVEANGFGTHARDSLVVARNGEVDTEATADAANAQQQLEHSADTSPPGTQRHMDVAGQPQAACARHPNHGVASHSGVGTSTPGFVGLAPAMGRGLGADADSVPQVDETEDSRATSDPEAWEEFYAQCATHAATDVEVPPAEHVETGGFDTRARNSFVAFRNGQVDTDATADAANMQQQLEHAADTSPSKTQRHRDVAGQPHATHAGRASQDVAYQSGDGTSTPGFVGLAPDLRPGLGSLADADSVPQIYETENSRATSDPEAWEEFYAQRARQAAIDVEVPPAQHVEASEFGTRARESFAVFRNGEGDTHATTDAANMLQQLQHAADSSSSGAQSHRNVSRQPQAAQTRPSQDVVSLGGVGTSTPGFLAAAASVRPGVGLAADSDFAPQADEREDSRATSDPEAWEELYAQGAAQAAIDVEVPLAPQAEASGPDADARDGQVISRHGEVDSDTATGTVQQQVEPVAHASPSAGHTHRAVAAQSQATHVRRPGQGVASENAPRASTLGFAGRATNLRPELGLVEDANLTFETDEAGNSRCSSDSEAWEEFSAQHVTRAAVDVEVTRTRRIEASRAEAEARDGSVTLRVAEYDSDAAVGARGVQQQLVHAAGGSPSGAQPEHDHTGAAAHDSVMNDEANSAWTSDREAWEEVTAQRAARAAAGNEADHPGIRMRSDSDAELIQRIGVDVDERQRRWQTADGRQGLGVDAGNTHESAADTPGLRIGENARQYLEADADGTQVREEHLDRPQRFSPDAHGNQRHVTDGHGRLRMRDDSDGNDRLQADADRSPRLELGIGSNGSQRVQVHAGRRQRSGDDMGSPQLHEADADARQTRSAVDTGGLPSHFAIASQAFYASEGDVSSRRTSDPEAWQEWAAHSITQASISALGEEPAGEDEVGIGQSAQTAQTTRRGSANSEEPA